MLLAGAASICPRASAQGTHLWQQSQMGEFEKGTPDGISIESDGHLRQGPGLTELVTTPSTFVWSLAVDKNGRVFAGTGSPATVLRLGKNPGDKPFTLFETRDLSIQALRFGPDGALYAATVPGGKVYKLNPDATTKLDESNAPVVFDAAKAETQRPATRNSRISAEHAIALHLGFDLRFRRTPLHRDRQSRSGLSRRSGQTRSAKPGATPELFFKSDEAHIRTLAWDAKGNLIAGSDGSGLVYRIEPRKAKATCSSKLRGARLHPLPSAQTEPSTQHAWATRAAIRCLRCRCRECPPSRLRWFSRSPCRPPMPARPYLKERRSLRLPKVRRRARSGPARTRSFTRSPPGPTACSRSAAIADRFIASRTTAVMPTSLTCRRSKA